MRRERCKTGYLTPVHQKLSHPQRVFVENIALFIGADVHAVYKKLAVLYGAEALFHADRAGAERLYFGAL